MTQRVFSSSTIALSILLITFSAYLAQPLWDTDFWWHIASGQWIVSSAELPYQDPFGVFGSNDTIRLNTVLRGQWLGQVILYSVFDNFGVNGIIALRALIILLCLILIYIRARIHQVPGGIALLYLALAGLISLGFTGARPQLLSFLFAALTFLIIDLFNQKGQYKLLIGLPLIAVIWANCHGGVILGSVLLVLYSGSRALIMLVSTKSLDKDIILLVSSSVFFILGSLLTPNGLDTYLYLLNLEGSQLQQVTSEYISSLKIYTLGFSLAQLWVWIILIIGTLSIAGLYQQHKIESLVLILLIVISVINYRYLAFLVFIGGPYICIGLYVLASKWKAVYVAIRPYLDSFIPIACGGIGLVMLVTGFANNWILRGGIDPNAYPIKATEFLKQNNISGRAFNWFRWGGYMIWHLNPTVKPYIDGRMLDAKLLPPYTHILWATPQGIQLFEQQRFDLVVLPLTTRYSGEVYKLHQYLNSQTHWRLIFHDKTYENYIYQRTSG